MVQLRQLIRAWGPVLALMALIFFWSAQPKHGPPAGAPALYFSGVVPVFSGGWDFLIKKGSHVVVYAVLTVFTLRALFACGWIGQRALTLALLLVVAFALSDEYHQSFTPGRRASLMDVGFDAAGAVLAGWILLRAGRWSLAARAKQ
jgi:VanZ family protein